VTRTHNRFPTHGPDLRALLAACHAEPDDDTPRLVLADWLDEHDDPRGELVRVQCRLHALPAGDPSYDALAEQHERWWEQYGPLWEKEAGNLMWDPGPHDRGLPTIGHYDNSSFQMRAGGLGVAKTDPLSATIATGWPGMAWATISSKKKPEVACAVFDRAPWAGSSTPVGVCFCGWSTITPAFLDRIAQVPNLRGLSLSGARVSVRLLPRITALTQLEHLDLCLLRLTDDGLKALAPLVRLRTLVSCTGRITDAGAKALAGFPELRELSLITLRLTAAGFRSLGRLTKLEVLPIVPNCDDMAIKHLRGLSRLRKLKQLGQVSGRGLERFPLLTDLDIEGTDIDDIGLRCLAGLTRLRALNLNHTQITGAGLRHLSSLRGLRQLDLIGTDVGDDDLVHLEGLTGLEHLGLFGTRVTKAGANRLKKKLPKVRVRM
jgi:uncharacterized protein (TIGR02996 family)